MRLRATAVAAIRSVFEPSRGGAPAAFDPVNVAGASVYEPWNFASMFQDAAQTVPVTAVGQSVRVIRDRASAGLHLSAASDAARPMLAQDGSGRYYLDFPTVTPQLFTASTVTLQQPALLAVLSSFGAGSATALAGVAQAGNGSTEILSVGYRASIMAARAQVRFDSQTVASVVISGTTNDIVADELKVHHTDAGSLVFRRGVDGVDMYSAATTWSAQVISSLAYRVGTIANAPFRFYGCVFAVGSGAVSAKAEIIDWLAQKKTL